MELNMSPMEAFWHFLEHWQGAVPKDVQEAKYAAQGHRKHPLGAKRIQRLLEKYAPGQYQFIETIQVKFTTP